MKDEAPPPIYIKSSPTRCTVVAARGINVSRMNVVDGCSGDRKGPGHLTQYMIRSLVRDEDLIGSSPGPIVRGLIERRGTAFQG